MTMQQSVLLPLAIMLISCGVAFACHGKLIASGISTEERSIILQEHNRLRQLVATGRYPGQPGAENMREIVWDDELAARAQQWADNCQFRHDPHRTINRFTMGQNLAIIWSTAPLDADDGDFPSRIQNWFNEVQKYSFGDAWSPKTGHYSQLVWGETSLVGCGFAEYKDNIKYNKLYVCNYGPGGNVVGYNPYEVGKPSCSTYGMKPSSRYQGLCAAPGASPAVANSVYGGNTFETYEYSYNSATTLNSNSNQNNNNNKPTNNINKSNINNNRNYNNPNTQFAYSSPKFPTQAAAPSASATSSGGSSFGTKTRGGSQAYTTEISQQHSGKYKHKLEAYRPSAAEFEKSVQKHTILRTYIEQNPNEQPAVVPEQQAAGPEASSTPKPSRGWSLLSWRG
ncbi:scoloptoxin SSD552 [Drosophila sulfurigaster albostrigata]|uniref:scoloptoxin SSD552 n=1 Tax=Drosophila sulfurigaster albostrigata TaxID=89887 RepID=UPI002D218F53|nr:scoloptoxin SSD552 [Drosophila sulfurigaster albostrigata]